MGKIKRFHYLLGKFMVFSTLVNFSASSYKLSKMFKLQIYFLVANLILNSCVDSGKLQTKSNQQNREASLQIKMEELVTGLHTKLDRFESRLQELLSSAAEHFRCSTENCELRSKPIERQNQRDADS